MSRKGILAGILFCLVVALYLPSLKNDFVYDDQVLILKQARPERIEDYTRILGERHFPKLPYYRPIPRLTMLVQKALHGDWPAPYHLFNAVLGGLVAVLAFVVLEHPAFRIRRSVAFLAALIFGVHPMASSCVYPACSGRETLIPSIFMLAAFYGWLKAGPRWKAGAVAAFAAALFSKEQAVVMPIVFVLADVTGLTEFSGRRSLREWVGRYAPMAIVFAFYVGVRLLLFKGGELSTDLLAWPLGPFWSYLYALQTFFVPFRELVYEPPVSVWLSLSRIMLVLTLAAVLAVTLFVLRRQIGKAVWFWVGWFVIVQLPTANLLVQEAHFDERYAFLASLGLLALLGMVVSARWDAKAVRLTVLASGVLWAVMAAFVSLGRRTAFSDDGAFSRQWVTTNPKSVIAQTNTGNELLKQRRYAEAEGPLRTALDMDPEATHARYNLALALQHQNRLSEAIAEYETLRKIAPDYNLDYNYGVALDDDGQQERAKEAYWKAIAREPGNAAAYYNLGLMTAKEGSLTHALALFRKAIELAPKDASVTYNMGVAYEQMGETNRAVTQYLRALSQNSSYTNAHYNAANLYFKQGRFADAASHYEAVLRLDPTDKQAEVNWRVARSRQEP